MNMWEMKDETVNWLHGGLVGRNGKRRLKGRT